MMNITIKLEENVDISFIKKMLSQIKGIAEIEVYDEGEQIKKAINKSREQIKKGESKEFSKDLLDNIFRK